MVVIIIMVMGDLKGNVWNCDYIMILYNKTSIQNKINFNGCCGFCVEYGVDIKENICGRVFWALVVIVAIAPGVYVVIRLYIYIYIEVKIKHFILRVL